jgi:hypothetical protein
MKHLPHSFCSIRPLIPTFCQHVTTSQQTSDVVVTPNIKNEILGAMIGFFLPDHSSVRLVNAETAHPEVPDGLTKMPRQVLLPSFTIVYLVALSETVAISVDPAWFTLVHE